MPEQARYAVDTLSRESFHPPISSLQLREVITSHGIQASADYLFKNAIFGRDSLVAGEHKLPDNPEIARIALLNLARLQGTRPNRHTGERRGAIPHEYRNLLLTDTDGSATKVDPEQEKRFHELNERWRLEPNKKKRKEMTELTAYMSVDATPLYIGLAADYIRQLTVEERRAFLDTRYIDKDGNEQTIEHSIVAALECLEEFVDESPLGLVEFKRTNPRLLKIQYWKDSRSAASIIHPDGNIANVTRPIASLQVQGLAYDAFQKASELFGSEMPINADIWREKAETLRDQTIHMFWMEDQQYFAQAIDYDRRGMPRQVTTPSSDAGALLKSRIFDDLPSEQRQAYVSAIVRRIFQPDMLTDAGIRNRSNLPEYNNLAGYVDYHGSQANWIKENWDIMAGLRHQGFELLAQEIEKRLLNVTNISQDNVELAFVIGDNVHYDPKNRLDIEGEPDVIVAKNLPEGQQTWSITAINAIKKARDKRAREHDTQRATILRKYGWTWTDEAKAEYDAATFPQITWQTELTDEIMQGSEGQPLFKTKEEMIEVLKQAKPFVIDREAGREAEEIFVSRSSRQFGLVGGWKYRRSY